MKNLCLLCLLSLGLFRSGYAQTDLDAPVKLNASDLSVAQLLDWLKTAQQLQLAYSTSHMNLEQRLQLPSATTVRNLLQTIRCLL